MRGCAISRPCWRPRRISSTRIGWRSLRLLNAERRPIDVLSLLPPDDQPVDHPVWLNGMTVPLRDKLPALDPGLARTWLLAHLIAAVLTDEIAIEIVGFPPSAA
jgi:hypothetical protein